ncbi:hypothetical protein LAJ55_14745, partial [Streptococcus pneumoniae]|uniref:DNA-directed RNA polymerase n=1 Tax=Streptococcus pneumoniae TaxID=1313 RepID=UPI001CBF3014
IKKMSLSLPANPFIVEVTKTKRSVTANFIHMIDSLLAIRTILRCNEANIDLFTVHDCFYVNEQYAEIIKLFYYQTALDLLFSN